MSQKVDVPISVILAFDAKTRKVLPLKLRWDGRDYSVSRIGLHHTYRQGNTLFHVFSLVAENVFFRLVFNTDNLFWRLEEIGDGF